MRDALLSGQLADRAMEIVRMLADEDDFVLICHVSPDGDAFGSTLALLGALNSMGKRVYAVCDGTAGHNIAKVLPVEDIEVYTPDAPQAAIAIALDCADKDRMGRAAALFDSARRTIVIDHHVSNPGYGDVNLVCSQAAATAELLSSLFDKMDFAPNAPIASYLYVGLTTDTGGFAYSNTSPHTLRTAANLVETGFDFTRICSELFRVRSAAKSRMLGKVLSDFVLECGGKYAHAILDYRQLSALNALTADSEGLVDSLRDIEGVEVAVYVRENAVNVYKVSMRSQDVVDVASICAKQDGGGHVRAAGFTWHGELDQLWAWLLAEVEKALDWEV